MNKAFLALITGLVVGGLITFAALRRSSESPDTTHEEEKESTVGQGTNGQTVLRLDKERQGHIGLQTAPLQGAQLRPEIKAYGQVLDPTPYATLLIDSLSAQAAVQASSNEYRRLKTLYSQEQNASARAVESAEATMKRDSLLLTAAQTKLALALGESVGSQSNLETFVSSLVSLKHGLVRMDVPIGESLSAAPESVRVAVVGGEERPISGRFLGVAPLASAQTQGRGFLFLLETDPPPPGTAVVGWLQTPGDPQQGVLVPRAAIIRHEGETFVYVQTADDTFERKQINLDRPLSDGWFVHEGLSANDRVVITGAQHLLSAELTTSGAEE